MAQLDDKNRPILVRNVTINSGSVDWLDSESKFQSSGFSCNMYQEVVVDKSDSETKALPSLSINAQAQIDAGLIDEAFIADLQGKLRTLFYNQYSLEEVEEA